MIMRKLNEMQHIFCLKPGRARESQYSLDYNI